MKLIAKTNINFISTAILCVFVGSFIVYFLMRSEINHYLDDSLIARPNSPTLIYTKPAQLHFLDQYADTAVYNSTTNYFEIFRYRKFYNPSTQQSITYLTPRQAIDNMTMRIVVILIVLSILLLFILYVINQYTIKRSWHYFYNTLERLGKYDINKSQSLVLQNADVDEFKQLNKVLESFAGKIKEDFISLKEYTENTSHELQTPLAIINSKLELLLQSSNLTEEQASTIGTLYETTDRLAKLNSSLLFLTKIDNRQFIDTEKIHLPKLIDNCINLYEDLIADKQITVNIRMDETPVFIMNQVLAETLIQCLLNNAIKHNIKQGNIQIKLQANSFSISNTGHAPSLPVSEMFKRFSKEDSSSKSLGIGLSIVKKICEVSDLKVTYTHIDHLHTLEVTFK